MSAQPQITICPVCGARLVDGADFDSYAIWHGEAAAKQAFGVDVSVSGICRMTWPATCAEVDFDMRDESYGQSITDAEVGDLLWNPKAADGHVIVAEVVCGSEHAGRKVDCGCGGWGMQPCPSTTLVCECGEDGSWRDHHYELLARQTPSRGQSERSSRP